MHGFDNRGEAFIGRGQFRGTGRFGRLFPELPSLDQFTPAASVLGAAGGAMDGGNPPASDTSQNNPRITAGYTFLGQFIDHDLTLDTTSNLEQQVDPDAVENFRTPALELDSLYGLGPSVQPYLYDQTQPFRFLINDAASDLPRNSQGRALIGDPRNDENIIVSQLHLLFLRFHNKVFNDFTDVDLSLDKRFVEAQRIVRWHYQWIIVNEFLPRILGTNTTTRIFTEKLFEFAERPFMPVEFSVAAYRFGHSQVRPGYLINTVGAALFPALPVEGEPAPQHGTGDLRGFRPIPPELIIDWSKFFGASGAAQGKLIDTKISTVLLQLPDGVVPPGTPASMRSLAVRNLQRGISLRLPSGQRVAALLAINNPLTESEVWSGVTDGQGEAPLWYYILKEAQLRAGGRRLAGVGAEIVGRVFYAILSADKNSYLSQSPCWKPTLSGAQPGKFTMTDLVNLTLGTNIQGEDLLSLEGDG